MLGRGPHELRRDESRRMNLNDDVVYRCLQLGPLHQFHPSRSRSLVRHHDRLHDNFLLGHLSLGWKCCSVGMPVRHLMPGAMGSFRKPRWNSALPVADVDSPAVSCWGETSRSTARRSPRRADSLQGSQEEHMSGRHSGNPECVPNGPYDVAARARRAPYLFQAGQRFRARRACAALSWTILSAITPMSDQVRTRSGSYRNPNATTGRTRSELPESVSVRPNPL
jgi:hypothetical protein